MTHKFLTEAQASRHLEEEHGVKRSPATLRKLRCIGGGPAFRHFGRTPLYTPEDLAAYVAEKLSPPKRSTSDGERKPSSIASERHRRGRPPKSPASTNETSKVSPVA